MRKSILLFGFCTLMLNAVNAQTDVAPPMYSKEYVVAKTNDFTTYFSLDETNRQKVMGMVYENNMKAMELEGKAQEMTPGELADKRKALTIEIENGVKSVLSESDAKRFEAYKATSTYF